MKRPGRPRAGKDPARRRAVDAAIRHAEKVVRTTGVTGPVLFHPDTARSKSAETKTPRPNAPSHSRRSQPAPPADEQRYNPALEMEIRRVFGLPNPPAKRAPPSNPRQGDGKDGTGSRTAAAVERSSHKSVTASPTRKVGGGGSSTTGTSAGRPEQIKAPKPKKRKAPKPGARSEVKKPKAAKKPKPEIAVVRRTSAPATDRKKGAAANAASRLAINARMRLAADRVTSAPVSPFVELQRRWQVAFSYLQRFEEANPDAPDVIAARKRLVEVEAEWGRRQALPEDHPDYFPWPSTDAPDGTGGSVAVEWQEIGMLGYLGYHVGTTSQLTAAQRTRLLGHVFLMRLPPLNGVSYMQSWGSPDTGPRLRKIAEALAAFARNAKRRRNPNLAEAIRQWEADLSSLRRTHYVNRFDFAWPTA